MEWITDRDEPWATLLFLGVFAWCLILTAVTETFDL